MGDVYPMIPVASKALWLLGGIGVLLLVVAALLIVAAFGTGHTRVHVDAGGVRIAGDPLFGRTIPWSELDTAETSIVPIAGSAPHRPTWRTWGTGLPGYAAGWFKLASGEKALVFVTGGERAVRVPTRSGWSLLVTVEQPEALADRLRQGS